MADRGFSTLVRNRTRRGGVLAPGASLTRSGENGKGVASRWYPQTLAARLVAIAAHADRFEFVEGDGLAALEQAASESSNVRAFVDPPYTAGGKRAGARLYAHNEIDHRRLFSILAEAGGDFLMTYDCCAEIAELVAEHRFHAVQVEMRTGHNNTARELVITRDRLFA